MMSLASWSQSRIAAEDLKATDQYSDSLRADKLVIENELSGLVEDIVENLLVATTAQFVATFDKLGKHWSYEQSRKREAELKKLEECIVNSVSNALLPVLQELQLAEVIKDFSGTLQKLIPEFGTQDVIIKAPYDLHTMLQEILHSRAIVAEITNAEDGDISVSGSQVVLVASLNDWSKRLKTLALS